MPLHQLIKRDEQNLELVFVRLLLEPTTTVVEMVAELHRVYSAKNKAYGLFIEESELAQALRLQTSGEAFSFVLAVGGDRTPGRTGEISLVPGGIVLFCYYRYLGGGVSAGYGTEQLQAVCGSMKIWTLTRRIILISAMRISWRVSILPSGETNPQSTRYLTFLKGRVGHKVAFDFFMDFLGASEGLNAKAQNRGLLRSGG